MVKNYSVLIGGIFMQDFLKLVIEFVEFLAPWLIALRITRRFEKPFSILITNLPQLEVRYKNGEFSARFGKHDDPQIGEANSRAP